MALFGAFSARVFDWHSSRYRSSGWPVRHSSISEWGKRSMDFGLSMTCILRFLCVLLFQVEKQDRLDDGQRLLPPGLITENGRSFTKLPKLFFRHA